MIARGTAIGSLITAASVTLTDSIITDFLLTLCLSFTQIVAQLQLPMWNILNSFPSHFATSVDCLPASTLSCSLILVQFSEGYVQKRERKNTEEEWHLPHHPVIPDTKNTKFRIVFDSAVNGTY